MDINDLVVVVRDLNKGVGEFMATSARDIEALKTEIARKEFCGGSSGFSSTDKNEHHAKFDWWVRKGDAAGLKALEISAGLSTVSDPDGGYLVPEELDKSIDKLAIDSVAMRRIARVITASGDYKKPFNIGGATGGWVGEIETRSETDSPELREFNPPWSELYMLPEVTQSLLDDAGFDVDGWLQDVLLDVETEMEGAAFISGNGVKQPRGILTYPTIANASWEWGSIGYIAGGHATLLNNVDKLKSLKRAVKPVYRQNGVWLMNDSTAEVISNFKDGNGNYVWKDGLTQDAPDILLGRPVVIDDNMADIGADAYPIAFGDFQRGYLIGDHRAGRRLIRDNVTKKGWVKFYLTKRVFGGCSNFQAIKLLKISVA